MQPKLIKMSRERRAWSRPLSVRGSSPNWANGNQFRDTPLDLGVEVQARNESATRKQRIPELSELKEVRREINDPLFVQPLDNPVQRMRVYYNSKHEVFIIQWVQWRLKKVSISISYPSFGRAYQRWLEDRVRWRVHKDFNSSG